MRAAVALSDLIIPDTETPGAKSALVNRFIDHLLAAENRETRRKFLAGLAYIDAGCLKQYGKVFVYLPRERQEEFLTSLAYPNRFINSGDHRSGHNHFNHLKGWISRTYYSSEIGMKELGWDGTPPFGSFQGCPHPEGTHERGSD